MQMSKLEIVGKYKRAGDKKRQLSILAQLNGCDEDDIKKILLECGLTEDDFPKKPGRKTGKKEEKKMAGEKVVANKTENTRKETLSEAVEYPKLSPEEEKQVDRALAIPEPVRNACVDRINVLNEKIAELEKERDCIEDYLVGVVKNG